LLFNATMHSYRDLPLRFAEFGNVHRNESSGSLHGLMRVRGFTQDDGHIFCTEAQIEQEVTNFHQLVSQVYSDFGFTDVALKLALRPEKRVGSDETWDKAEESMRQALRACGVTWEELPGEGAFYGPKIEYHMKDSIGRSWQCGTMQVDFSMPQRLGAEYVAEDNSRQTPVMLHRAVLGSIERFIGILIENFAGALPTWLAPAQVKVLNISAAQADYAQSVVAQLQAQGIRASADLRNEKITYKIREHSLQKIPYLLIVGDKEMAQNAVGVRQRFSQDTTVMPITDFITHISTDIAQKTTPIYPSTTATV
jgi:threonyl-tRNA synthetase